MEHWYSFLYLYGVGGILFAAAIFLGLKKGVLNLKVKHHRKILFGFGLAYFIYFSFQGIWNIAAIQSGAQ